MSRDRDVQLIQEKMIGCGSFTWSDKHNDTIDASDGFFEMLELDKDVMSVDKLKSLILDEDLLELKESFRFNTNHKKDGFDMLLGFDLVREGQNELMPVSVVIMMMLAA